MSLPQPDPAPLDLFWAGIALTFGATIGFIAGLAFGV